MIELSASGLQDWRQCERLWALSRYYKYEGPPSIWTAIGKTVHKTIELVGQDERPLESVFKEQFKLFTKGVPSNGLPISRLKSGLLCSMGHIDWIEFKKGREPEHEVYFSKILGDIKFRGFVDCMTKDKTIFEWKSTSKKDLPVEEHIQQGTIYKEMAGSNRVFLVYFTWRNGQIRSYELSFDGSYIPEIERVAQEIAAAIKKGTFQITGKCKDCWERKECQSREW